MFVERQTQLSHYGSATAYWPTAEDQLRPTQRARSHPAPARPRLPTDEFRQKGQSDHQGSRFMDRPYFSRRSL